MADINVTPLVDVMLVLLVIFMVTAPMMVQGVDINLPATSAPPLQVSDEPLVLSITAEQGLYIGTTRIPKERLVQMLSANAKLQKEKEIMLKADRQLSHGFVMGIMAKVKESGVERIGVMTE